MLMSDEVTDKNKLGSCLFLHLVDNLRHFARFSCWDYGSTDFHSL